MSVWLISPIVTCSLLGELSWCLAVFVSWACMHAHACTVQDNVGSLHCRCFMAFTCCLLAEFRWLFHSFHWWIVELRTQWAADNGHKHGDQILCTSIMRSFDDRLKKKKILLLWEAHTINWWPVWGVRHFSGRVSRDGPTLTLDPNQDWCYRKGLVG